jgi:hypothetical protein
MQVDTLSLNYNEFCEKYIPLREISLARHETPNSSLIITIQIDLVFEYIDKFLNSITCNERLCDNFQNRLGGFNQIMIWEFLHFLMNYDSVKGKEIDTVFSYYQKIVNVLTKLQKEFWFFNNDYFEIILQMYPLNNFSVNYRIRCNTIFQKLFKAGMPATQYTINTLIQQGLMSNSNNNIQQINGLFYCIN